MWRITFPSHVSRCVVSSISVTSKFPCVTVRLCCAFIHFRIVSLSLKQILLKHFSANCSMNGSKRKQLQPESVRFLVWVEQPVTRWPEIFFNYQCVRIVIFRTRSFHTHRLLQKILGCFPHEEDHNWIFGRILAPSLLLWPLDRVYMPFVMNVMTDLCFPTFSDRVLSACQDEQVRNNRIVCLFFPSCTQATSINCLRQIENMLDCCWHFGADKSQNCLFVIPFSTVSTTARLWTLNRHLATFPKLSVWQSATEKHRQRLNLELSWMLARSPLACANFFRSSRLCAHVVHEWKIHVVSMYLSVALLLTGTQLVSRCTERGPWAGQATTAPPCMNTVCVPSMSGANSDDWRAHSMRNSTFNSCPCSTLHWWRCFNVRCRIDIDLWDEDVQNGTDLGRFPRMFLVILDPRTDVGFENEFEPRRSASSTSITNRSYSFLVSLSFMSISLFVETVEQNRFAGDNSLVITEASLSNSLLEKLATFPGLFPSCTTDTKNRVCIFLHKKPCLSRCPDTSLAPTYF